MVKKVYTREEFIELCGKKGIKSQIAKIDESKIDTKKFVGENLMLQFNIPKDLPKRVDVAMLSWSTKCQESFEELLKKSIKRDFGLDKNYSWFRLDMYPHNYDFDKKIK